MSMDNSAQVSSKDETAVREVLDRMVQAWADNEAAAFAGLYSDDATVVLPGGVFHKGRGAIENYMAMGFGGPLKGTKGVDEPEDVRVLGDTAIVISKSGILMPGETELPPERLRRATWVFSKSSGDWVIEAYTNTPTAA